MKKGMRYLLKDLPICDRIPLRAFVPRNSVFLWLAKAALCSDMRCWGPQRLMAPLGVCERNTVCGLLLI